MIRALPWVAFMVMAAAACSSGGNPPPPAMSWVEIESAEADRAAPLAAGAQNDAVVQSDALSSPMAADEPLSPSDNGGVNAIVPPDDIRWALQHAAAAGACAAVPLSAAKAAE